MKSVSKMVVALLILFASLSATAAITNYDTYTTFSTPAQSSNNQMVAGMWASGISTFYWVHRFAIGAGYTVACPDFSGNTYEAQQPGFVEGYGQIALTVNVPGPGSGTYTTYPIPWTSTSPVNSCWYCTMKTAGWFGDTIFGLTILVQGQGANVGITGASITELQPVKKTIPFQVCRYGAGVSGDCTGGN